MTESNVIDDIIDKVKNNPIIKTFVLLDGRLNRQSYLVYSLAMMATLKVLPMIVAPFDKRDQYSVSFIIAFILLWPTIVVQVKRWHDRGKSGWWCVTTVIPVLQVWMLIETYFLPSESGPNKHGEEGKGMHWQNEHSQPG